MIYRIPPPQTCHQKLAGSCTAVDQRDYIFPVYQVFVDLAMIILIFHPYMCENAFGIVYENVSIKIFTWPVDQIFIYWAMIILIFGITFSETLAGSCMGTRCGNFRRLRRWTFRRLGYDYCNFLTILLTETWAGMGMRTMCETVVPGHRAPFLIALDQ